MLPTFVGIGAQRAATTWIYQCLREHPEISLSDEKELEFFNRHFDKGIAWYESQFCPLPHHKAVGEITPVYLSHEFAISRMSATIPEARLFVVLREPVARAYSAYQLHRDQFSGNFIAACRERPEYLIDWGLYAKHLKRVLGYYDRSQVKTFLYDDLQSDPDSFFAELFTYLEVDSCFRPQNISHRYNRIIFPRAQRLLHATGLGWAVDSVKNTWIGHWIRAQHAEKPDSPFPMREEQVRWLRSQFREDILELQQLINRDLSHWL